MLSFQVHDLALQIVFKLVKLSFHVHDLTLIGINWFVNAPNHSHWILLFVATGFVGRFREGLRYELNPTSGFKRDVTNYPHWILLFVATGFVGRFRADLHYKLNPTSSWPLSCFLKSCPCSYQIRAIPIACFICQLRAQLRHVFQVKLWHVQVKFSCYISCSTYAKFHGLWL